MTLLGVKVITLEADVSNVVVHGEAKCAFVVFPLEIYAGVQITLPFFSDIIVFFEGI